MIRTCDPRIFFDVEKFGEIRYSGKALQPAGGDYELMGDLTIRGVTKPVTVKVHFGGFVVDPYGQTKAGFEVEGKISRKEFGLMWNDMTEAGQIVVGDEIRILCEVQLIRQEQPITEKQRTGVESNAY